MSGSSNVAIANAESVLCGQCNKAVPNGAHIVISPVSPDLHVVFCPTCCPCQEAVPSSIEELFGPVAKDATE